MRVFIRTVAQVCVRVYLYVCRNWWKRVEEATRRDREVERGRDAEREEEEEAERRRARERETRVRGRGDVEWVRLVGRWVVRRTARVVQCG